MVAMMRRHVTGELRTFSIGFRAEKFNELPFARQGSGLTPATRSSLSAIERLGEMAWHGNEPMAGESIISTFDVTRLVHRHVTVAYLGDGGAESFPGYQRYRSLGIFPRYCMIHSHCGYSPMHPLP